MVGLNKKILELKEMISELTDKIYQQWISELKNYKAKEHQNYSPNTTLLFI